MVRVLGRDYQPNNDIQSELYDTPHLVRVLGRDIKNIFWLLTNVFDKQDILAS